MDRGSWRVLLCLGLVLVLFPLTLAKPGLPTSLKADEAAYYLMALSLAHDHDLRLDLRDVDRAFAEFPFRPVSNLIAMTDDGWQTVYFGKPYIYSLFGVPWVWLWGGNGLLALNMALLVAMIAMGASYLGRYNPPGTALLLAAGFFLISTAFCYAFWIQPEVFSMAAITACLFFGLRDESGGFRLAPALAAILSSSALALATYNKPIFALLGVPVLAGYLWRRRFGLMAAWLGGAVGTMAVLAGIALVLTGHPSSYLGVVRQGVTLCQPDRMPIGPVVLPPAAPTAAAGTSAAAPLAATADQAADAGGSPTPGGPALALAPAQDAASAELEVEPPAPAPKANAWSWIFRIPPITFGEFLENLRYFFLGRHTGLVLYLPFALVAVLLFVGGDGRRSRQRWLLLAALAGVALFFLTAIFFNWHGGGGFVGNRYFAAVYPGFLFLVTRVRWQTPILAGFAWGGICLGPLLFTPFGAPVPEPTLQAHVRNAPFSWFPLELSLRNVPGYDRLLLGDARLMGRRDVFLPRGESVWLRAGNTVEMWLQSERPIEEAFFEVASGAPDNTVRVRFETASQDLRFAATGDSTRLALRPGKPSQVRTQWGSTYFVYQVEVAAERGRVAAYARQWPPNSCPYFSEPEVTQENFSLGAELTYLGDRDPDRRAPYALAWGIVQAPASVRAGQSFEVPVQLWNRSAEPWSAHGAARVRLAYHWLLPTGDTAVRDGERTELPRDVPPGGELSTVQRVVAPEAPGLYVLELDPVYERIAWFSERNGGATARATVEVVAP
jgi:hypothetical protein